MHYLGLALYAEGPTDYYFLRPLLLRLCDDICRHDASQRVELSEDVIALDHPDSAQDAPRERRVIEAAQLARGAWRIVFVHTDGAGDSERQRSVLVQPALDLLQQHCARDGVGVAVIPVRETEAWALADGDALRQVFGTTLDDTRLGLPAPGAVESERWPKERLEKAFFATGPSARRRRQGVSPLLNALGDTVALSRLRQLAGFRALETELRQALHALNILRPDRLSI